MAKKEQPVKEKKVKPQKGKKQAKNEGAVGLEQEAGGKKKGLPRLILLIAIAVVTLAIAAIVIFVVLPKLSGEEPPEGGDPEPSDTAVYYDLPENFDVGEQTVPAPVPLIAANVQAIKAVRVVYTYVDLTNSGEETANYVSKLVSEGKFFVVDEEFVRTDAPDFTAEEGEVLLAKNLPKPQKTEDKPAEGEGDAAAAAEPAEPAATEPTAPAAADEEPPDMVLSVRITWKPGTFVIVSDQEEGKVTTPPRGPNATSGGSLSLNGGLDYIKGLSPSVLGLSGESMDDYRVYAVDGTVMVNGKPCMRMQVYSRSDSGGTNAFEGIYFLANDGQRLYRLNEDGKGVTELKLP